MTTNEKLLWIDGKAMYQAFINSQKCFEKAFPRESDFESIARQLDLTVPYVQTRIWFYLKH